MGHGKGFLKGALVGALAMCIVGILVGNPLGGNSGGTLLTSDTQSKIAEIRKYIDKNFLYKDKINEEALQEQAIKGYVNGLEDPYTVYYNEEETRALFETTTGEFGGIGVVIKQDQTTGLLIFMDVYENSPGEKAGFRYGDLVYKVDGQDVTQMDMDTIVSMIRGEVGSTVEITVLRGPDQKEYTGIAKRALIENDTVEYEMKKEGFGYISISGFEDVTYKQFKEALDKLTEQQMTGLVIDLRNNPGGNLNTVCEMLDLILPKGVIVSVKDRDGNGQKYMSDDKEQLNVPLVVLINQYSASASEIFAGAVKDHEIGTLVGITTYGKGVVQNVYRLRDGTAFKVTSSEYFTPKGQNIHGIGIKPDVEVAYEYDATNPEYDNQLNKALEVLKNER